MNLEIIIKTLSLNVLTKPLDFSTIATTNGYAADLLSCVMAGAKHQGIWVTLQSHLNIVAIAALLDLNAVIITENAMPDEATIEKANKENITLLSTPENTFNIVGKLWEMGIRD